MPNGEGTTGTIMSIIKTPLGVVVLFIILLVLASLSIASAISGQLTAAAVSGAGLITLIVLLTVVSLLGK